MSLRRELPKESCFRDGSVAAGKLTRIHNRNRPIPPPDQVAAISEITGLLHNASLLIDDIQVRHRPVYLRGTIGEWKGPRSCFELDERGRRSWDKERLLGLRSTNFSFTRPWRLHGSTGQLQASAGQASGTLGVRAALIRT